jgi:hypothetical protein
VLIYALQFRASGYKSVVMHNATKRGLRSLPFKFGPDVAFRSAAELVKHLNRRRGGPNFVRIEGVIEALYQIEREVAAAGYPSDAYTRIYEGKFGEKTKLLKKIVDDFMHEIQLVVAFGEPRRDGWSLAEVLSPSHPEESGREAYLDGLLVFNAAVHGYLRLVSQCDSCGHWFVRHREDHRYCSAECREKAFRGSDEGKVKRAKFMREYRARLKRRDAENLKRSAS